MIHYWRKRRWNAARAIHAGAVTLMCVLMLVQIVRLSGARSAVLDESWSVATAADGSSADALVQAGTDALQRGQVKQAERLARKAVGLSPLSADASALLIATLQAQDRDRSADRLLDSFAALGWRNADGQYLLVYRAAMRGDIEATVLHADALLRLQAGANTVFPLLRRVAASERGRAALAGRLVSDPPWRSDFLIGLRALTPSGDADHLRLLIGLAHSSSPVIRQEFDAFVSHLAAENQAILAQQAIGELGRQVRHQDGLGSLALTPADTAGPLDWAAGAPATGALTVEQSRSLTGRLGIHIVTDQAVDAVALRHTTFLVPGLHMLTWIYKGPASLFANQRLVWRVQCIAGGLDLVAFPSMRSLNHEVTQGTQRIMIPSGCRTQKLSMLVHNEPGQQIDATLLNVSVSR